MNIKKNLYKINLNAINGKLSGEFPNTKIIITNNKIHSLEIYYNNSKTNKKIHIVNNTAIFLVHVSLYLLLYVLLYVLL